MRCAQCGRKLIRTARGRPRRYCDRSCQARAYRARRDGTPPRSLGAATKPGERIDRQVVVAAAIALADDQGLAAVTMRVLAARLGIATVTLYRYVSHKEALVSHMVSRVLDEYEPSPVPLTGWRQRLTYEVRQEWELYRRHSWVLPVLATTRPPLEGALLAAVDRSMSALYSVDGDHHTAMAVYQVVSSFVQGAALLLTSEAELTRHTGIEYRSWWQRQERRLAGAIGSGRYPWLSALAEDAGNVNDVDEWFSFGLDRVLDGVAGLMEPADR